jgi:hypothetical protein
VFFASHCFATIRQLPVLILSSSALFASFHVYAKMPHQVFLQIALPSLACNRVAGGTCLSTIAFGALRHFHMHRYRAIRLVNTI